MRATCLLVFLAITVCFAAVQDKQVAHNSGEIIGISTRHQPIAGWKVAAEHGIATGSAFADCPLDKENGYTAFRQCRSEARTQALLDMRAAAGALGANKILGAQFHYEQVTLTAGFVTVYGTACTVVVDERQRQASSVPVNSEGQESLGAAPMCGQLKGRESAQYLDEATFDQHEL